MDQESAHYARPHDAPRCPSMDSKCWEVKWQHRDDCVSALMVTLLFELFHSINDVLSIQTLKRVPHLTVTWAHQPSAAGNNFGPNSLSFSTSHPFHSQRQITSPQFVPLGYTGQNPSLQSKDLQFLAACAYVSNTNCQSMPENPDYDTREPIRDWSEETDISGPSDSIVPGDPSWDVNDSRSSWGNAEPPIVIESATIETVSSAQPK